MAPKTLPDQQRCSIARTLDIVGEKWSLLIIRDAFRGRTTFTEFRDLLGIPSDILTARLSTLVDRGIFEKRSYRDAGNRERFSYHLTEAGNGLKLILAAINQWGDEFNPSPFGKASLWEDDASDENVSLVFLNDSGAAVSRAQVRTVPGPGSITKW